MKKSAAITLSIFGVAASAVMMLSSCNSDDGYDPSDIDTGTIRPSVPAATEVTTTTAVSETITTTTTTAAASTTTASSAVSEPDKAENTFTDEQLNELAKQQKQQLMSVSVGYKDGYLAFARSKLIFKAMLGSAGKTMDSAEAAAKITEMENEYYNANLLVFSDKKDFLPKDFKLTLAEDDLQTNSAVVYRMTFTADADGTAVPMEGIVLDLGKSLLSVSRPAEGITP